MKAAAFLRAINVGGHTVKMDELRRLFQSLGLQSVETYIASGNVIFETDESDLDSLTARIERELKEALGYPVETFVRALPRLAQIAAFQPFADMDGATLMIGFLDREPDTAAAARLLALTTPTDSFKIEDREIYWLLRTRFSESTLTGAALEKALGMPTTLRNANTVQKIAAKWGAGG